MCSSDLFELSDVIVDQPKAGRVVPELGNANIRERFLYSYRLIYEMSNGDDLHLGSNSWQTFAEGEV